LCGGLSLLALHNEKVTGARRWIQLALDFIWKGKIKERLIIITKIGI
jgi:hypothetical protein